MTEPDTEAAPLRLAETVVVSVEPDSVRLIRGAEVLRIRGSVDRLAPVIDALRGEGVRLSGVPHEATLHRVTSRLERLGWLSQHDPEARRGTAVERQLGYLTMFGSDAVAMQERIERSRVAVLGAGAVGGVVAQHLVGSGVRFLWLVDHDRVERHNLNRQFLAGWDDVGLPKTSVASRALRRLAPDAEIRPVDAFVERPEDLHALPEGLDLLVVAADTPPDIVGIAWRWAAPRGVPIAVAAVGLGSGYWGPVLDPGKGHCWHCFERVRTSLLTPEDLALERDSPAPTPYSFGPANTVVSALLAHEVICFLATGHCSISNRRGYFNFSGGATSFLEGGECGCHFADSLKGKIIG
ncbi:ThiF family adenylyltransferase [Streptomyces sp. NPDC045431]|uniref:ThiF family adenylyltransferase n=1 Tax=Streptomyces sp. NPDC045431 TaxID=3155613 RepID=UPI0033EFC11E